LHCVIENTRTEDITILLEILKKYSTEEGVDLLVLLLYRKHSTWDPKLSPKYTHFIGFLEPFLRCLKGANYNFNTFYKLLKEEDFPSQLRTTLESHFKQLSRDLENLSGSKPDKAFENLQAKDLLVSFLNLEESS